VQYRRKKLTFAISSPDEFLFVLLLQDVFLVNENTVGHSN